MHLKYLIEENYINAFFFTFVSHKRNYVTKRIQNTRKNSHPAKGAKWMDLKRKKITKPKDKKINENCNFQNPFHWRMNKIKNQVLASTKWKPTEIRVHEIFFLKGHSKTMKIEFVNYLALWIYWTINKPNNNKNCSMTVTQWLDILLV